MRRVAFCGSFILNQKGMYNSLCKSQNRRYISRLFQAPLGGRSNHGKTQNDSHAGVQHRQADYGNLSPSRCAGHPSVVKRTFAPIFESTLKGEMQNHLGYASHARTNSSDNARNGYSEKTLKTTRGEIPIHVPRGRQGSFKPQIVKKP